ncbi:MAG: LysR family transcriptional regulator [Betaproteobacteria bacterium RBG_16_58_11]|nr:MAG: LysR family transcriptional regulator [Betaproteobacteria bacterium RBG_16_58_11]
MAALPSLRQLSYLIALADRLNFTQAAQDCFVTQSTLSAGIMELESILNARLVERERHRVFMTPLGLAVTERARTLIAAATDLVESTRDAASPLAGIVRLGVIPTIAPFLLPQILPDMRAQYPALQFALREDITSNLLARLDSGQLDLALIALPFETGKMLVRELFSEELWLVTPPGEKTPRRLDITTLDAERLLLLEEGHCLRGHTLTGCGLTPKPTRGFEATSLYTLVQMIEEGMGVGLLPEMTLQAGLLRHSPLIARPFAAPAPRRGIALVARPSTSRREVFDRLGEVIVARHKQNQASKLASPSRRGRAKRSGE